jgi:hypothetical protein
MYLGLYKIVGNEERLVDYGVFSKHEEYEKQGYMVRAEEGKRPALYKNVKARFDALWDTLSPYQQNRLCDMPVDDETTIYEKFDMLQAEVVNISRLRVITNVHRMRRPKSTLWGAIKRELTNLFTIQQEVCYA